MSGTPAPPAGRTARLLRGAGLGLLAALGLAMASVPAARAQGALSAIESDVDRIARRTRPSIVTVFAQRQVTTTEAGRAPQTRMHSRVGTGVAVDRAEVLTTASVVLGAERVFVRTDNGLQVEARLAGLDPVFNVALLEVPDLELPALRFATRPPQLGDWVIALGSSYRAAPTQSVGTVAYRFKEPRSSLLQLTNEVYPGNSGGAALNSRGELVGLVQGELGTPEAPGRSRAERRPGGMSFVIPVEDVLPIYRAFKAEGRSRHGLLGVSTTAAFVDSESEPGARIPIGALVEAVAPGGPAARLGLRKGDLIVAFDGERVEYPEQLARWVAQTRPGTTVRFVWVRDELQQEGRVALAESPEAIPSWMFPDGPPRTEVRPAASVSPRRIAEIEDQIRRLSTELQRLRGAADSSR